MNKKEVILGFAIGLVAPLLVMVAFTALFISGDLLAGFEMVKDKGKLGRTIQIGLLANMIAFMISIRNREAIARGILVMTLVLLTVSLIV